MITLKVLRLLTGNENIREIEEEQDDKIWYYKDDDTLSVFLPKEYLSGVARLEAASLGYTLSSYKSNVADGCLVVQGTIIVHRVDLEPYQADDATIQAFSWVLEHHND